MQADCLWLKDPALRVWLECARLSPSRGIRKRTNDPKMQEAGVRYAQNAHPAAAKLQQLLAQAQPCICARWG